MVRNWAGVVLVGLAGMTLGACGGGNGPSSPSADVAPVDVKMNRLGSPEFATPYIDKRVRTYGVFMMINSGPAFQHGKYRSGWTGASFSMGETGDDGKPKCGGPVAQPNPGMPNMNAMMGGVGVFAPTALGQEWLDAKSGGIYEIVGVLRKDTFLPGLFTLEVESMKLLPCAP